MIALLGITGDDLSVSEYASTTNYSDDEPGNVPSLDLDLERAVQAACLEAAEQGLLQSAHDCADGGLAVALAECCFSSLNRSAIGADVELIGSLPATAMLFSESPSRIVISFERHSQSVVEEIVGRAQCPITVLGYAGGNRLQITVNGNQVIDAAVDRLEDAWRNSLADKLQAEAMAAGRE